MIGPEQGADGERPPQAPNAIICLLGVLEHVVDQAERARSEGRAGDASSARAAISISGALRVGTQQRGDHEGRGADHE